MAAPNYNNQSAGYHGIKNAKYAIREELDTVGIVVVPIEYAKSISFDPTIEQQPVYFNDTKIMAIVSDQGYTGAFGTSAQDRGFETALEHIAPVSNGIADIMLNGLKRFDMYYEYQEKSKSGIKFTVKVWVLNVETTKSAKAHNTDTNSVTLGEYSYPMTVYGDKIKNATGDEIYRDENGNEITATRIISVPSDTGYADFDKTVPVAKMPTPIPPAKTVMKNATENIK